MATVQMRHPLFPDRTPVEVTERAFDNTWEDKGWELVNPYDDDVELVAEVEEPDEVADSPDLPMEVDEGPHIPALDTMGHSDLLALAEELGIETADIDTEGLRQLISDTPGFYADNDSPSS